MKQRSKVITLPGPRRGWIANTLFTKSPTDAAEVLDNWFPTAQGARLRGGSELHATIDAGVVQMFTYATGGVEQMYAATANDIFEVTSPADAEVAETPVVSGLSTGDWSSQVFTTSGGDFIVNVNGADAAQIYDGADWNPITDEALFDLGYDALATDFVIGETLTGGTSGATAEILGINKTSATAGTLKLGAITGGPYQDNEAITSASGAATADGASAAGSTWAISGVQTSDLSHVWAFKNRLWFIEKNTVSAWYLGTNAIAGAATEFPLRGVFNKGGNLVMGANWSIDSGDGIDDIIVFITDRGEAAVYVGTDPGSNFALRGVYNIGKPLNKHCSLKAGGDLLVGCEEGIFPFSVFLQSDLASAKQSSVTFPIEDAWAQAVAGRSSANPITMDLWSSNNMLMVGTPALLNDQNVVFVANARTGAWCRFIGWDVRCGTIYNDDYYFGTSSGTVLKADTGGSDNNVEYAGVWVPKFQEGTAEQKVAHLARFRGRAQVEYDIGLAAFSDYEVSSFQSPSNTSGNEDRWGTGLWGTMTWGGVGEKIYQSEWQTVTATGTAISPALRVAVNQSDTPDLDAIALDVVFEVGNIL